MATGAWARISRVVQDNGRFRNWQWSSHHLGAKAVNNRIGRTLGGPDSDGSVLVKFDFTG
jgi:hypothetical protein